MPEQRPFEMIVKHHIEQGNDIHSAFGKAITEDPEAYGRFLKRQKHDTIDGGVNHDTRGG